MSGQPVTWSSSFTPIGTPPNGLVHVGAAAAARSACSRARWQNAFRSLASMAAYVAASSSTGERSPLRNSSTNEQASPCHGVSPMRGTVQRPTVAVESASTTAGRWAQCRVAPAIKEMTWRTARPGMTVPLPGPLHSHRDKLGELADLGYTDIWSAESDGADGFTPLALAAAWEPRLRLGTAIVPAFTRSPACFAQCVASMADAAPGRFAFGVGSSSNVIVERWNGVPFVEPYKKVRDVVRFLRDALRRGEGLEGLRHVRGAGLPARRATGADAADPRRRVARGHAAPCRS